MNTSKAAAALVRLRKRMPATCEQCRKPFESRIILAVDNTERPESKFCSTTCSRTHRNARRKVASNLNRLAS